jgi:hypothetical protein
MGVGCRCVELAGVRPGKLKANSRHRAGAVPAGCMILFATYSPIRRPMS